MSASFKQPISVLVVIYTAELDVLLLERADFPNHWQSVTGSVEWGESIPLTALREVGEETGIDAARYSLTDWHTQNQYEIFAHWRHRYPPLTTHNLEHVFGLRLPERVSVTLSPREHLNYQWLPWQQASEKVFSPSNQAAILQLPQFISQEFR
ncbi:MAG: dihydroneopterin triphosphate diphosphatase [Gallionella sp.]|nr:dihydroneopterin triphosphate diphosphatase [Gallionella sp.]